MIDIYPQDANVYNPTLDTLVENIMAGEERPELLNLIREIESDNNPLARNKTTTASGVYQFTKDSVITAKNRAKNLGFDKGFVNLIPNDPTQWTDKESDIMITANLFAQETDKPGFVDELLEQALQGNRQAMQEVYYMLHHTAPDEATKKRVNKIMPLK